MKDYNENTLLEYEKMITFIDEIRAYSDCQIAKLNKLLNLITL